jgi:hypothetical protein
MRHIDETSPRTCQWQRVSKSRLDEQAFHPRHGCHLLVVVLDEAMSGDWAGQRVSLGALLVVRG